MRKRVRNVAWLSVALACLAAILASGGKQDGRPALVLRDATAIDATGAPPKAHYTVVIIGDRISAMGVAGGVPSPKGTRVVDATGKFLIPGLWDMHVHWYDKRFLPLFIANGVTGIRMMWGFPVHHEWRKAIRAGQLLGPRMVIASMIVGGPRPWWPGEVSVGDATQARQAVIDAKQSGADFVKVYTFLPRAAYFAIADESKKLGIPFEGHLPLSVTAQQASDAGQRSFEHLLGVMPACSTREHELERAERADLEDQIDSRSTFVGPHMHALRQVMFDTYSADRAAALFALFRKNGTWQCPTFTELRISLKDFADDPSFARDPGWLKYMPHMLRDSWGSPARVAEFAVKQNAALSKAEFQRLLDLVGAMQKAGVGILAGTDTGNPFVFPGFSLHDELDLLVRAGLTPMEALQAATLNAALDSMLASAEALAGRKSIAEELSRTIDKAGVDSAVAEYHRLQATQPAAYDFGEAELDGPASLRAQLQYTKKFQAEIRILRLDVESYPHSSIAYENLGEAYAAAGDTAQATASFRKSLHLDPANFLASRNLRKLGTRPGGDR